MIRTVTRKGKVGIVAACGLAPLAAVLLSLLTREPYHGGNLYAQLTCKSYLLLAEVAAQEHYPLFAVAKLNPGDRTKLARNQNGWTGGVVFLVKSNFTFRSGERQVVIVCNTPFNDEPQPTLWQLYRRTSTYAAGYSDGSRSLISSEQFAA